jgi:hypothetical protein
MNRLLLLYAVLFSGLAAPPVYRIRVRLNAAADVQADADRVAAALQRGLYADSLIAPGADSLFRWMTSHVDSIWKRPVGHVAFVTGSVVAHGESLEIQLRLVNLLLHPMVAPDTLRIERSQLDSAVTDRGRRYARVLAGGRP